MSHIASRERGEYILHTSTLDLAENLQYTSKPTFERECAEQLILALQIGFKWQFLP